MAEPEIKIRHVLSACIVRKPPFKILEVTTTLAEHPGQPGFDAEAQYDMLKEIDQLRETLGFDHPVIKWGVSHA